MSDDDEDTQPKTLAERIALLGLGSESARPASRVSQRPTPRGSMDTVLSQAAAAPAKPPSAPRPLIPNKLPVTRAPIQAWNSHGDIMQHDLRNGSSAVQAPHGAELQCRSLEPLARTASVKDRIQSLYLPQNEIEVAVPNPFASPELPDTSEMGPVSPLPPLPSAVPVFARRATDAGRHPAYVPSEGLVSPHATRDMQPFSAGTTPRQSIGRSFRRPPMPQMSRPTSVLSMNTDSNGTYAPYLPHVPPKPAGLGSLKVSTDG
ncbi:hypothetical protein IW141_004877 [Coemansia sp. RSA 355]|nr:hypothetical protein IW141_004877 [Coemansia sp. RSA 355]